MKQKCWSIFFKLTPGSIRFSRKRDKDGKIKQDFQWKAPTVSAGKKDGAGKIIREWRWGPPPTSAEKKRA